MESGDNFDDDSSFRSPPSPDDRLWRHPSELGQVPPPAKRRRTAAAIVVASGVTGAALAVGMLVATGTLTAHVRSRAVLEREIAQPIQLKAISDNDVERLADAVRPSIVVLRIDGASAPAGAGVVFRDDGHVLTNAHVVSTATTVDATLSDGRTMPAKVLGTDRDTDLAVLALQGPGPFEPAWMGTSDGVAVGDTAIAVGTRVSPGVVSALGREVSGEGGPALEDLIQTDATIDQTSSGGALLRDDGAVIGITTGRSGSSQVGFATPVDVARVIADDLVTLGRVRSVWLGIRGTSAPDGGGVVVAEAIADGPAQRAGIVDGDVIRRIDGHPVASMAQLRIVLRRNHPGDAVRAVFDRKGQRREVRLTVAERPTTG